MTRAIEEKELKQVLGRAVDVPAENDFEARLAEMAMKEGVLDVVYATFDSPFGTGVVAATPAGLVRVGLPNEAPELIVDKLAHDLSPRILEARSRLDTELRELDEYFAGRRREFDLPIDWTLAGSGFYGKVLHLLPEIPYGRVATYGEMAALAGNAKAHRAAGTACGSNPVPIVVPCHRVVRSGGALGNYGGGPEMKRFLLEHEGAI
jgi:methylated-DNA-[protein]-cysteine S-methyltransferase